eukprot:EG_transcript_9186
MDADGFRKLYEEKKGCPLTEEDEVFLANLSMKEMVDIWDMIKEEKDWVAEVARKRQQQENPDQPSEEGVAEGCNVPKDVAVEIETNAIDVLVVPHDDKADQLPVENAEAQPKNSDILDNDDDADDVDRRTAREQRKEDFFREQREREQCIEAEVEKRVQEEIQRRLEAEVARRLQGNPNDESGAAVTQELAPQIEQAVREEVSERAAVIEECQKEDQRPQETPESTDTQSAKKRRLPLHETPNAKRKRSSPTMAERVLKYQKRTPPRFRSVPRGQSVGPTRATEQPRPPAVDAKRIPAGAAAPAPAGLRPSVTKPAPATKHTQPRPFSFNTDRRASQRLSVMGPPAPLPPQAKRPSQSLISRPSQSTAPIPKQTVPRPFRLSISNRSSSLAIPAKPEAPPTPFRATPLNRKMFASVGEVGVPRVAKRETTVPQDFGFMKRELEKQKAKAALKKDAQCPEKENLAPLNGPPPSEAPTLKRPRAPATQEALLAPAAKRPRTRSSSAPKPQCPQAV